MLVLNLHRHWHSEMRSLYAGLPLRVNLRQETV